MHSGAARKPRSPTSTAGLRRGEGITRRRSEEHTSELQSQSNLVCRLLLEKKKKEDDHASGRGVMLCRQSPGLGMASRVRVPGPVAAAEGGGPGRLRLRAGGCLSRAAWTHG